MAQPYELYYWPSIQGRGEFVRLALEEAGVAYEDVARNGNNDTMFRLLDGSRVATPPFAPPFLKAGRLLIGQTANILLFLGSRHGLAPAGKPAGSGRINSSLRSRTSSPKSMTPIIRSPQADITRIKSPRPGVVRGIS